MRPRRQRWLIARHQHGAVFASALLYRQFADTYQEANGLLTAERVPKFTIDDIFAATTGVSARSAEPNASSPRQVLPDEETDDLS